jgi:hypothetical protein
MTNQDNKNEIAQELCKVVAEKFRAASRIFNDPGEALAMVASISLVGVTSVSMYLSQNDRDNPPRDDDTLFACLFIAAACSFSGNGTAMIEFDIINIIKILDQFHQLTGRHYERHLNTSLFDLVSDQRNKDNETFRTQ